MKNAFLVLIILLLLSCRVKRPMLNDDSKYLFVGGTYSFSDNSDRHIKIKFLNDSILRVENVSDIPQHHYVVNFKTDYKYQILNIATVVVKESIAKTNGISKNDYLKPYEQKQYILNKNAIKYIFPDIQSDTIRFGNKYLKAQLKEFNFDLVK